MKTIKDILYFCNAAIFYDYENKEIKEGLKQVRKYIINDFYKTIRIDMILRSLSIINDVILKINDDDIKNINDDIHNLRENILYMLSFEKLIKDNNGKLIMDYIDNE